MADSLAELCVYVGAGWGALNISSLTGLSNFIPQLGLALEVWGGVIIQQEGAGDLPCSNFVFPVLTEACREKRYQTGRSPQCF